MKILKGLDFNTPPEKMNEVTSSSFTNGDLLGPVKGSKKGRKKKQQKDTPDPLSNDGNEESGDRRKGKSKSDNTFNTGRWQPEEHQRFIEAILKYGNEWKLVQQHVVTRSSTQARSHAQKFFVKIKKTNLLDFNIDLNKNSIKSLHEQANQMNSDQYLNTIKTLNNIAFEKKSGMNRTKRKKDDQLSLTPSDEAIMGSPEKNVERTISNLTASNNVLKPNNIKILTISNEQDNYFTLSVTDDIKNQNIIINNNINNININFSSSNDKNFTGKKRQRQNSMDVLFNNTPFENIFGSTTTNNYYSNDDFQNFFIDNFKSGNDGGSGLNYNNSNVNNFSNEDIEDNFLDYYFQLPKNNNSENKNCTNNNNLNFNFDEK
jgi:SHAQKYF class myb-like DNA-binding protein